MRRETAETSRTGKQVKTMPYIAPEIVAEARRMDLLTYLKIYEPHELVRFSGNVYTTRTHGSLKISNGKWMWWSQGIGSNCALDYLVKVKGYSFLQAVETIMGGKSHLPIEPYPQPKEQPKVLFLPEKSASNDRITEYLFGRGIDFEIISYDKDLNGHWITCDECSYRGTSQAHEWAENAEGKTYCTVCSGLKEELESENDPTKQHKDHKTHYKTESDKHWFICDDCNYEAPAEAHKWVTNAETGVTSCSVCKFEQKKYTATFSVPKGVTPVAQITAGEITFPNAGNTVSAVLTPPTFLGWVKWQVGMKNTELPSPLYKAGDKLTLTENTTFYALYAETVTDPGTENGTYKLVSKDSDLKTGKNGTNEYVMAVLRDGVYYFANALFDEACLGVGKTGIAQDKLENNTFPRMILPQDASLLTMTEDATNTGYYTIRSGSAILCADENKNVLWSNTATPDVFKPNFTQNSTTNGCVLEGKSGAKLSHNTKANDDTYWYIQNTGKDGTFDADIYLFNYYRGESKPTTKTYCTTYPDGATRKLSAGQTVTIQGDDTEKPETPDDSTKGNVVIDGKGNTSSLGDFIKYGPKTEVYLSKGQSVSFYCKYEGKDEVNPKWVIRLGAKAVNSTAATMKVVGADVSKQYTRTISTATEMYYDISACGTWGEVITVYNEGDGVLALTDIWGGASTVAHIRKATDSTSTQSCDLVSVIGQVMTRRLAEGTLDEEELIIVDSGETADPNPGEEPTPDDPGENPDPDDPGETPKPDNPGEAPKTDDENDPPAPDEPVQTPVLTAADFADLTQGTWYYDGVDEMLRAGLMNGVSAAAFEPDGTLTRAMVVTILYRRAGSPETANAASFADVPADAWYAKAVAWAVAEQITNGVSETTFAPDEPVTRQQLVTFLWRFAGAPAASGSTADFADAAQVAPYAETAFAWATGKKLISGIPAGDGVHLDPQGTATRAQAAVLIARLRAENRPK